MAFAGGKTTVYEGGLRVPFVVRNPYEKKRGIQQVAMISHIDITPTLLDFAGTLDTQKNRPRGWEDPKKSFPIPKSKAPKDNRGITGKLSSYHGKSWLGILGQKNATHWESIFASHTFHEIQMYYPMRVYRDREYKLIWNIAHPLPYPSHPISGQQAVFRHSIKSPSPLPMGTRPSASISTGRNLNSSKLGKTPTKPRTSRAIQNLPPNLRCTKKN
jgi:N-sulfoglucosamine sulfohydrolase